MLSLLGKIKVDAEALRQAEERLRAVWNYEEPDSIPLIIDAPIPKEWPVFAYSEEFKDMRKMLINQLASVYVHSKIKDDAMLTIRANYGVGIIPSSFGCEIVLKGDNMPWPQPILRDAEEAYALRLPDLRTSGLCGRVLETMEFYEESLRVAGLDEYVHVYLADTQGPLDLAFILRGVDFYKDLFTKRKAVHRLLDVVTEAYIEFSKLMKDVIGEPYDEGYHMMIRMAEGGVRICEDVAVNLSPEAYLEFSKPYNERAFEPFRGGYIHFCGKGHHILRHVLETKWLRGLNLGNPEFYDVSHLMELLSEHKICLIGWPLRYDREKGFTQSVREFLDGLGIRTGIIVRAQASGINEARRIISKWRSLFR